MPTLAAQVEASLRAHTGLATFHEGRVYTRPLKRSGNRATPEAFDSNGRIKRAIVIADGGDNPSLAYENRATGYITIWLHGPDTETTRQAMELDVTPAIIGTLQVEEYEGPAGTGLELSAADRLGVRDDPGNADAILDYVRFSVAKIWSLQDD